MFWRLWFSLHLTSIPLSSILPRDSPICQEHPAGLWLRPFQFLWTWDMWRSHLTGNCKSRALLRNNGLELSPDAYAWHWCARTCAQPESVLAYVTFPAFILGNLSIFPMVLNLKWMLYWFQNRLTSTEVNFGWCFCYFWWQHPKSYARVSCLCAFYRRLEGSGS